MLDTKTNDRWSHEIYSANNAKVLTELYVYYFNILQTINGILQFLFYTIIKNVKNVIIL